MQATTAREQKIERKRKAEQGVQGVQAGPQALIIRL